MRIGIITDIHENVIVLENALRLAENDRCDHIACLGDIVGFDNRFAGYSFHRSASQCISLVRSNCRWVVAGNHDLFAASRQPSYSNGFAYPDSWFNMTSDERRAVSGGMVWTYDTEVPGDLNDNDMDYIRSLPEYIIVDEAPTGILLSHYVCPDFTGSTTRTVMKQKNMDDLWSFMNLHGIRLSLSGHFHKPHASFAHMKSLRFARALHSVPGDRIFMGDDISLVLLPPLAGTKSRSTCAVFDTGSRVLSLLHERI
jgi:predicted phosphodiesterase